MSHFVICEGKEVFFEIPEGWNVLYDREQPPVAGVADGLDEIRRALDNPIGSKKLEDMARPGMEVTVLFDDLQRPTPAHLAIPEILNRLNGAGIPDSRVSAVCALGTHPILTLEQMEKKIGVEASRRLEGRVFCHDPHSPDNVVIGRTHRGTTVEVNPHVAFADLIIGIGECMPHPIAGYGGGCKIIMPGVCSYRSVAEHHYTWMRHPNCRVNILEGNPWYEEIIDAGRIARLSFKLDLVMNEKKEIIKAFAGEPVAEHKAASEFARSLYWAPLPKVADITITSAFPLEIGVQATKALTMAGFCTRTGGTIIWVAPQRQAGPIMPLIKEMASDERANEFHRRLYKGEIPADLNIFGISYIMQVVFFKELSEKFKVIHVTEGLAPEQVKMMKFIHASTVQEAVNMAARDMPVADVAIFPSGGNVIPGLE
ncbi:MAG: nickel-dependent lactate racemase [Syntrophorhabdaceae bacterium]|nr:nickel-dependent lactate racemase [Syntrophorhabdaceae bacterium]